MTNEAVLDNPVWFALTEIHQKHSVDFGNVKFYNTDYTPFGAFINNEDTSVAIEKFSKLSKDFFIVGSEPKMPTSLKPAVKYVGLQMIIHNKINYPIRESIVELNASHYQDLMELIKIAFPDFFRDKTNTLGSYYGIYKNKKLVAVTGERMQTNNFIEISAVATHPHFLGNGYAKQLVTYTANKIFEKNKTPFLHVDQTNLGPINLYKKLGFIKRRTLEFWRISRA